MLSGLDEDIAKDCTRTINWLRNMLTQIYPSFERALVGNVITRPLIPEMLIHYVCPHQAEESRLTAGSHLDEQSFQEEPHEAGR